MGAWAAATTRRRSGTLGALLKAGVRGVRESAPSARVMLPSTAAGTPPRAAGSSTTSSPRRAFDAIGLSYYPWWHGTLESLSQNLAVLANRYDRDLFVVETAYPWTLDDLDEEGNLVGLPGQLLPGYAATRIGQAEFLRRLVEVVSATPRGRGRGVFTWAPEYASLRRRASRRHPCRDDRADRASSLAQRCPQLDLPVRTRLARVPAPQLYAPWITGWPSHVHDRDRCADRHRTTTAARSPRGTATAWPRQAEPRRARTPTRWCADRRWLDPDGDGDPADGVDGYRLDHV